MADQGPQDDADTLPFLQFASDDLSERDMLVLEIALHRPLARTVCGFALARYLAAGTSSRLYQFSHQVVNSDLTGCYTTLRDPRYAVRDAAPKLDHLLD